MKAESVKNRMAQVCCSNTKYSTVLESPMMTLHMQMLFGWKYQLLPKKSLPFGFFKTTKKPRYTKKDRATATMIRITLFNEDLPCEVI